MLLLLALAVAASFAPLRAQSVQSGTSTGSSADAAITLTSPLDYQVFQRSTRLKGKIEIDGHISVPADRAEERLTGDSLRGPLPGSWVSLSLDKRTGAFHASISTIPGGFYRVEVRALRAGTQVAQISIPHVGLGEVFVVSGQSNSTNYGEVRQVTETRMVSAFDGRAWRIADDPQPGVQDGSHKGSFIPAFGDALYRKYRVPIGIADVGHGSTSVRQWLPAGYPISVMPTMTRYVTHNAQGELVSDGTLFNGMMQRIHQLGRHGFRALLWHQGESDSNQPPGHNISAATYRSMMVELIRASRRDADWNFPWFVAEATYQPKTPSAPEIEAAQRSLWRKTLAFEGPNTDTLGPAWRQDKGKGVHFNNDGLKKHGQMWAAAVEVWLDKKLH